MGQLIGSQGQPENGAASAGTIAVWDLPLRLFHWSLAATVMTGISAGLLGELDLHVRCGQIVLALLLFRIVWGFVGPEHARFRSFVRGPRAIFAYVRSMLRPPHHFHAGHNPLGALVVILMLALLLAQALSGLFANNDIATEGPLARFISKAASDVITGLHDRNGWLIIGLIALHIGAVFGYLLRFRDNLIRPMITGTKSLPAGERAAAIRGNRLGLALVVLALCALVVWLVFAAPRWIAPMPF
jgi:cytochrome b